MRVWSLSLCIVIMSILGAQPKPVKPTMESEPEAERYLKALQAKLHTLKNYKLSYTLSTTDPNGKTSRNSGSYLGSQDKFSIQTQGLRIVSDGIIQWTINTEEKEIQIQKLATKKQSMETPIGIVKNYNKLFKYRVKEKTDKIIILELVPLNKNMPIFKVDLSLDMKRLQILETKLYDRGGFRIVYSIDKMEENLNITSSEFMLQKDKYKDFELLDLR